MRHQTIIRTGRHRSAPKTVCSHPGCRALVVLPARRCAAHAVDLAKRERDRRHDAKRQAGKPWRGWYKTRLWSAIRKWRLSVEPLCRMCDAAGRTTLAAVVDHIEPHRGDRGLFFSRTNTQSLCKRCHDGDKQAAERGAEVFRPLGVDAEYRGTSKPRKAAGPCPAAPVQFFRAAEIWGGSR